MKSGPQAHRQPTAEQSAFKPSQAFVQIPSCMNLESRQERIVTPTCFKMPPSFPQRSHCLLAPTSQDTGHVLWFSNTTGCIGSRVLSQEARRFLTPLSQACSSVVSNL